MQSLREPADQHARRHGGQKVLERMPADPAQGSQQLVIENLRELRYHVKQHGDAKPDAVSARGVVDRLPQWHQHQRQGLQ
jgi:hypothetical protein